VFFECFSQDESSYGRLGVGYDVFQNFQEFACGTTNIDYSAALYDEFQKIRSYKTTRFEVTRRGLRSRPPPRRRTRKSDRPARHLGARLPASQLGHGPAGADVLPGPDGPAQYLFPPAPARESVGPRSLRYCLEPGRRFKVVFDPWSYEVLCPRSIYEGTSGPRCASGAGGASHPGSG